MDKLWNSNYLKAWTANFMLYFSFMVVTPLFPLYLSEVFGATKDETGMVLSGYALTALLIRPFSGFLVDSFPRKMVLLVCYGLFALFFGGYLVAGSLLSFCIIRTLHGAVSAAGAAFLILCICKSGQRRKRQHRKSQKETFHHKI